MKLLKVSGVRIAVLECGPDALQSERDALDLIGELTYIHDICHLILPAAVLNPAFFDLRSGFAGAVLQKFVNYGVRVAVVGDFSKYESNALRQFIMESNRGKQVYFAATDEEAIAGLTS